MQLKNWKYEAIIVQSYLYMIAKWPLFSTIEMLCKTGMLLNCLQFYFALDPCWNLSNDHAKWQSTLRPIEVAVCCMCHKLNNFWTQNLEHCLDYCSLKRHVYIPYPLQFVWHVDVQCITLCHFTRHRIRFVSGCWQNTLPDFIYRFDMVLWHGYF